MSSPPLAEMCRTARKSRNISQKKFAELIGSNQTEISFIERGFVPESKAKIEAIKQLYSEI